MFIKEKFYIYEWIQNIKKLVKIQTCRWILKTSTTTQKSKTSVN
jgi:hypothetical protein